MSEGWGASGGRLALSLDVEITANRIDSIVNKEEDPMLKQRPFLFRVVETKAKYITLDGEQVAEFASEGGWKIRFPQGSDQGTTARNSGKASLLRCYLDLKTPIARNDVRLEPQRLYMTARCWREEELDIAFRRLKPIQQRYETAKQILNEALSHETGDRRLDGTNIMETFAGMRDTAQLVLNRDEALRELQEAKNRFPSKYCEEDIPEGPWPGQVQWLSIEPQYVMIRRKKIVGDEYHNVGTWTVSPVLDNEAYEEETIIV